MKLEEAVNEAYQRWGEAAAIYKDRSRRRERYEVGYFRRNGDLLVFHIMGSGNTLEIAFDQRPGAEFEPSAKRIGSTPNANSAVNSGYE